MSKGLMEAVVRGVQNVIYTDKKWIQHYHKNGMEILKRHSKVTLYVAEEELRPEISKLAALCEEELKGKPVKISYFNRGVDIYQPAKEQTIQALAKYLGISLKNVLVAGDSSNDFNMLNLDDVIAMF